MAPNPKVASAYRAMTMLGIQEVKVKPVLKKLLKLYDKNWELIEEENYRALADAIFEEEEKELQGKRKKSKDVDRLRLRGQESQASHSMSICGTSSAASPSKMPKIEGDTLPESSSQQPQYLATSSQSDRNAETEVHPVPQQDSIVDKGKQPLSPHVASRGRRHISERAAPIVPFKESTAERGILPLQKSKASSIRALIIPKDEPVDDLAPISVVPPEPTSGRDSALKNNAIGKQDGHDASVSKSRDGVRGERIYDSSNEEANRDVATKQDCSSTVEIASSSLGEVKISVSCSSALGRSDFRLPSRDQILKKMEDKCLRSYKITDPNFSVMNLLRDMCDCMLEFRTDSNDDSQEGSEMMSPNPVVLKKSKARDTLSIGGNTPDMGVHSHTSNGSINVQCSSALDDAVPVTVPVTKVGTNDFSGCDDKKKPEDPIPPSSGSLMIVPQHQLTPELRSLHCVDDLSKGEENVRIPWVNTTTSDFPSPFHYLHQSVGFREAHVNFYLSNIGHEDYCSTCLGNCLSSSTPCACANKTGGGYAYTSEGLVKEEFLDECITISRNPQQHQFYCKDCPLERAKNDDCLEPCKGHLKRKFIKECWIKCGCVKQCGNRVVQRGITCNLQVFLTSEGKGWGLRTLEELPKGAFVCEFVGEILTIKELHERNIQCTENEKYTYPILLDADWDSGFVKDREALCLDAASYGNVARFINHRCLDANLIEIPVEVETPNHNYYHLAFFTSRKIAALEELTWVSGFGKVFACLDRNMVLSFALVNSQDYSIDFDDHEHPIKLFCCSCGSKFCRKMKRSNRSTRSAPMA
ncbi:putative inactive histone-lysine N-methyltransferase SUVR2 isoform X1 [Senna tora]|uniref:Putative inactive histone-lysine N-methyltransferase SUVR2 isoform X1 n=1 Tax=Senna tora TaxID=362788 RepID=A0A834TCB0_9FABA|nr:putative inactive histone-lysine N-methyltransferase SUVR2 isoform X1 [Senna tora]